MLDAFLGRRNCFREHRNDRRSPPLSLEGTFPSPPKRDDIDFKRDCARNTGAAPKGSLFTGGQIQVRPTYVGPPQYCVSWGLGCRAADGLAIDIQHDVLKLILSGSPSKASLQAFQS
jgi:hypothetical protein